MSAPVNTICPYCGVGCGVIVNAYNPLTVTVHGDEQHPANIGRLCSKGTTLGETISLNGRLLYPIVNGNRATWDNALTSISNKFLSLIETHGPDSVAFYVSGQLLTEEYYVANKLMKGFIGSGNIDTNSRLCMASAVAAHKRAFGEDIVPGNYEDLERADLVILVGSNLAWCHPVIFQRIRQAKNKNKTVVVIDPRRTQTCDIADLHLQVNPGTDSTLFNGLLNFLRTNDGINWEYLENNTEGFSKAFNTCKSISIPHVARQCGLPEEDVAKFFVLFKKTEKVASIFSQGINQSTYGTDNINAVINCHLAAGKIGKDGSTVFSITGQPNAMGGREVGGLATQLASHMDFTSESVDRLRRFWNSKNVTTKPGLKAVDLFAAIKEGTVKAVWIMATNPAVSLPNSGYFNSALQECEFVVVSDCVQNTDTTQYANVLLPARAWGEKDGTVTNSERTISRQRTFLPSPGESAPDWWIITQVAKKMGFENAFNYNSPYDIFIEHATLSGFENNERLFNISKLGELSKKEYDTLEPIQWPVTENSPNGTKRLFTDGKFSTKSGKAALIPIDSSNTESVCDEYPLILNTGRIRDQWHTMTRTSKTPKLTAHISEPFVEIHPSNAKQYNIENGDLVQIQSTYGQAVVRASITISQKQGTIFVPIHWNNQFSSHGKINSVVKPNTDKLSGQPGFKYTPVKISLYKVNWHGFILSRDYLILPKHIEFWTYVSGLKFYRYEVAGNNIEEMLSFIPGTIKGQWIEYTDKGASQYRFACLQDQKMALCAFFAPTKNLPARDWLSNLFQKEVIDEATRKYILLGRPVTNDENPGKLVCSCFGVGELTIINLIQKQNMLTIEQIGSSTNAGTNCGSCIPELHELLKRVK